MKLYLNHREGIYKSVVYLLSETLEKSKENTFFTGRKTPSRMFKSRGN